MKLLLSDRQFNKVKQLVLFIFDHYPYNYDTETEVLTVDIPSYEDVDYTKYMQQLKEQDRINFCIDILNFAV